MIIWAKIFSSPHEHGGGGQKPWLSAIFTAFSHTENRKKMPIFTYIGNFMPNMYVFDDKLYCRYDEPQVLYIPILIHILHIHKILRSFIINIIYEIQIP